MQESIIDAELLILISNARICGRQVHRRVQSRDRRMLISTGRPVTECCRELELAENYLRDLERGDFIERMAFYIAEIHALHHFREGSGRFLSKTAVARR